MESKDEQRLEGRGSRKRVKTACTRTFLRVAAGLVGMPFVVAGLAAAYLLFVVCCIAIVAPFVAVWLVAVLPVAFIWACAKFAMYGSAEGFAAVGRLFAEMAELIRGSCVVMVSTCRETCKGLKAMAPPCGNA